MYQSVFSRLVYWFWFSLLLSLAPLGYSAWELITNYSYKSSWDAVQVVLSRGELILVCVPLLGGAIGEIVSNKAPLGVIKATITGLTMILFFFASTTFASISKLAILGAPKSPDDVLETSFSIFFGTLMVGVSAILIKKKDRLDFGGQSGF